MATLLGVICTDVKIAPSAITSLLRLATNRSFNSISIDGDTSTNDTLNLFANGAAAPESVPAIALPPRPQPAGAAQQKPSRSTREPEQPNPDTAAFSAVLASFMTDLAKLVVRDGEGATKFVTIRVQSDVAYLTAKRAAVSIARSALVKTALYGKDANWGRILCAIGYAPGIMSAEELPAVGAYAGAPGGGAKQVVPERTSVSFVPADGSEELKLVVRGEPEAVDEARAKQILEMEDLEILVRLDDGPALPEYEVSQLAKREVGNRTQHEAVCWTCDFSHEYVTINGDYRT
ncbi:hypothetical protein B0A55_02098 [Friedmanniomyces simplex]|uniref:Arginine biosynthesis bifunctional protein ArgJ, mitochondrial n=1 Tax=Friedmanniomyces simplex TaxID=329884 RepID=A0A4U0XVW8_9PEZI|nr:hypothetical protein B0A55_02098 [Friedmanniomyces simplex]